jgi:glycosyltransferase involved in cell wall biosynthesis
MGVPVIASAIGGLPELIEEGVNGFLCPPADGKAIATRLLELAADRPRLENMKKAARLRAVANLGVAAMADGYRTALLEAMRIHREEVATELNTPPSSTATH